MNALAAIAKIRTPERWAAWAKQFGTRATRVRRYSPASMRWVGLGDRGLRIWERTTQPLSLQTDVHLTVFNPVISRERAVHSHSLRGSNLALQTQFLARFERRAEYHHSVDRRLSLTQQMLSRIVDRSERREERSLSREVVIVHAAPAGSRTGRDDTRTSVSRPAPDQWSSTSWPSTRSASAPTVNVDQIAETVMRQLDRRIESWRERTGRR
jgi:hypothetical protein